MALVKRLSLLQGQVISWSAWVPGEAQIRRPHGDRARTYYANLFWAWLPVVRVAYPSPINIRWSVSHGYRFAEPDSAVRTRGHSEGGRGIADGYAGVVDDFDGVFQRRAPPGQHELTLYRDGYRTVHQTLYLAADSTFKVRFNMEKLVAGDVAEQRPTPRVPPPGAAPQPGANQPGPGGPQPRAPIGRRGPAPLPPNQGDLRVGQNSAYGTLAIRVQPGNATVTIDGERWDGPQGQDRLTVELAEGTHRVQVQREGFDAYSNDVMIRRGETTTLNVSLRTR